MLRALVLSICLISSGCGLWSQETQAWNVLEILRGKDAMVDEVLSLSDNYRLQFICTVIDSDFDGGMQTDRHLTGAYHYPASTVKLPVACLTLEKMNRLGLQLEDRLILNRDVQCGNTGYIEKTQPAGLSFRELLEEMLVMSNNEYYSALYHFLTPGEMYQRLSELGYSGVHIFRAFNGCELDAQLKTTSWRVERNGKVIAQQKTTVKPLDWMSEMYVFDENKLIGDWHEYQGEIRPGPFDFNYHLELPLEQLHAMVLRLTHPQLFPEGQRWQLNPTQQAQMLSWMANYPSECCDGAFSNAKKYPNAYYKYFLLGESNEREPRTVSKIGLSYGFVTEVAHVHCADGRDLLFTVSMYVNENKVVNDGKYEYETLARPFLARVGTIFYEYFSK